MNTKKTRGLRKSKGYAAGEISKNLYIASVEHIPGNELIAGEALQFFYGCKTCAELFQMSVKSEGYKFQVQSGGIQLANDEGSPTEKERC